MSSTPRGVTLRSGCAQEVAQSMSFYTTIAAVDKIRADGTHGESRIARAEYAVNNTLNFFGFGDRFNTRKLNEYKILWYINHISDQDLETKVKNDDFLKALHATKKEDAINTVFAEHSAKEIAQFVEALKGNPEAVKAFCEHWNEFTDIKRKTLGGYGWDRPASLTPEIVKKNLANFSEADANNWATYSTQIIKDTQSAAGHQAKSALLEQGIVFDFGLMAIELALKAGLGTDWEFSFATPLTLFVGIGAMVGLTSAFTNAFKEMHNHGERSPLQAFKDGFKQGLLETIGDNPVYTWILDMVFAGAAFGLGWKYAAEIVSSMGWYVGHYAFYTASSFLMQVQGQVRSGSLNLEQLIRAPFLGMCRGLIRDNLFKFSPGVFPANMSLKDAALKDAGELWGTVGSELIQVHLNDAIPTFADASNWYAKRSVERKKKRE